MKAFSSFPQKVSHPCFQSKRMWKTAFRISLIFSFWIFLKSKLSMYSSNTSLLFFFLFEKQKTTQLPLYVFFIFISTSLCYLRMVINETVDIILLCNTRTHVSISICLCVCEKKKQQITLGNMHLHCDFWYCIVGTTNME